VFLQNQQDLNTDLFENALSLPDIKIRECLVPRTEIVGVEIDTSIEELQKIFEETKLSKLIVYEESLDTIVGYVHQLDLFKKPAKLATVLHSIPLVPESMNAADLISLFSKKRKSIAWVVDEFGGTAGIVTLDDLVEELIGDIRHEDDEPESEVSELDFHGEVEVDGLMNLDDFADSTHIHLPQGPYETVAGFVISKLGTLPAVGKSVIAEQCEFEILSMDVRRISRVRVSRIEPGSSNHGGQ
jgi:putative hemolysin